MLATQGALRQGFASGLCSAASRRQMAPRAAAAAEADSAFAAYVPATAFLFPGQGAQAVGMAKVSRPSPFSTARPGGPSGVHNSLDSVSPDAGG